MKPSSPRLFVIARRLPSREPAAVAGRMRQVLRLLSRRFDTHLFCLEPADLRPAFARLERETGVTAQPGAEESRRQQIAALAHSLRDARFKCVIFLGLEGLHTCAAQIRSTRNDVPYAALFLDEARLAHFWGTGALGLDAWEVLMRTYSLFDLILAPSRISQILLPCIAGGNTRVRPLAEKELTGEIERLMRAKPFSFQVLPKRMGLVFLADDGKSGTLATLRALRRNTPRFASRSCCVLDASRGASRGEIEREYPFARWLKAEAAGGVVPAVNQAFRRCRVDFLVYLRSGAHPTPDWWRLLLRNFQDPWVGAVLPHAAEHPLKSGDGRLDAYGAAMSLRFKFRESSARWLNRSCWILKRSLLDTVGLLDERLNLDGTALIDYSFRLRQAGVEIREAQDAYVSFPSRSDREPVWARGAEAAAEFETFTRKWNETGDEYFRGA